MTLKCLPWPRGPEGRTFLSGLFSSCKDCCPSLETTVGVVCVGEVGSVNRTRVVGKQDRQMGWPQGVGGFPRGHHHLLPALWAPCPVLP
jgi:hypothetical protein